MASKNAPAKAERTKKSPAERAQEAFDRAGRVVAAAEKRLAAAQAAIPPLEEEVAAARKRRDYLGANPDLPAQAGAVPVLEDGGDIQVDGGKP
jgi:hypothetical protein